MSVHRPSALRARWPDAWSMLACVLALVSLLGLVLSALAMTYLNLRFIDEVDPLSRAVSYYVFVERGDTVFTVTLIVLAVATTSIIAGMARLPVRLGASAAPLFGASSVALVLSAIFPTDNSGRVETTHGLVHQFAGSSLYVSLPLGGLALARSLAARAEWAGTARIVRRLSVGCVALAIGYLVARFPDLLPWFTFPSALDLRPVSGLVQRVLFGFELAMLLVLAVQLLRVAPARRRPRRRAIVAASVPTDLAAAR